MRLIFAPFAIDVDLCDHQSFILMYPVFHVAQRSARPTWTWSKCRGRSTGKIRCSKLSASVKEVVWN